MYGMDGVAPPFLSPSFVRIISMRGEHVVYHPNFLVNLGIVNSYSGTT